MTPNLVPRAFPLKVVGAGKQGKSPGNEVEMTP